MFNELLEKLKNTEFTITTDTLLLMTSIIIGTAVLCVLMFFGLKKCINYGNKINYHIVSFNILLMAIPILLTAIKLYFKVDYIEWYMIVLATIICWTISIVRNVLHLKTKILYILLYTFYQMFFAFLGSVIVFSVVVFIIFVVILLFIFSYEKSSYDSYREAHDFAREKASYGGWVRDINGESYQFVKNGNASPNYVIDSKGEWHNVTYDEDGVHIMGHYHDDKLK